MESAAMGPGKIDAPRAGVRIGALAGWIVFLIIGLAPAFYMGRSAMLFLLSYLSGGPVSPTLIIRVLLVTGSVADICLAGAIFHDRRRNSRVCARASGRGHGPYGICGRAAFRTHCNQEAGRRPPTLVAPCFI
jgi:hypothetical protein